MNMRCYSLLIVLLLILALMTLAERNGDKIKETNDPNRFCTDLNGDDTWYNTTHNDEFAEYWAQDDSFHVVRRLSRLIPFTYTKNIFVQLVGFENKSGDPSRLSLTDADIRNMTSQTQSLVSHVPLSWRSDLKSHIRYNYSSTPDNLAIAITDHIVSEITAQLELLNPPKPTQESLESLTFRISPTGIDNILSIYSSTGQISSSPSNTPPTLPGIANTKHTVNHHTIYLLNHPTPTITWNNITFIPKYTYTYLPLTNQLLRYAHKNKILPTTLMTKHKDIHNIILRSLAQPANPRCDFSQHSSTWFHSIQDPTDVLSPIYNHHNKNDKLPIIPQNPYNYPILWVDFLSSQLSYHNTIMTDTSYQELILPTSILSTSLKQAISDIKDQNIQLPPNTSQQQFIDRILSLSKSQFILQTTALVSHITNTVFLSKYQSKTPVTSQHTSLSVYILTVNPLLHVNTQTSQTSIKQRHSGLITILKELQLMAPYSSSLEAAVYEIDITQCPKCTTALYTSIHRDSLNLSAGSSYYNNNGSGVSSTRDTTLDINSVGGNRSGVYINSSTMYDWLDHFYLPEWVDFNETYKHSSTPFPGSTAPPKESERSKQSRLNVELRSVPIFILSRDGQLTVKPTTQQWESIRKTRTELNTKYSIEPRPVSTYILDLNANTTDTNSKQANNNASKQQQQQQQGQQGPHYRNNQFYWDDSPRAKPIMLIDKLYTSVANPDKSIVLNIKTSIPPIQGKCNARLSSYNLSQYAFANEPSTSVSSLSSSSSRGSANTSTTTASSSLSSSPHGQASYMSDGSSHDIIESLGPSYVSLYSTLIATLYGFGSSRSIMFPHGGPLLDSTYITEGSVAPYHLKSITSPFVTQTIAPSSSDTTKSPSTHVNMSGHYHLGSTILKQQIQELSIQMSVADIINTINTIIHIISSQSLDLSILPSISLNNIISRVNLLTYKIEIIRTLLSTSSIQQYYNYIRDIPLLYPLLRTYGITASSNSRNNDDDNDVDDNPLRVFVNDNANPLSATLKSDVSYPLFSAAKYTAGYVASARHDASWLLLFFTNMASNTARVTVCQQDLADVEIEGFDGMISFLSKTFANNIDTDSIVKWFTGDDTYEKRSISTQNIYDSSGQKVIDTDVTSWIKSKSSSMSNASGLGQKTVMLLLEGFLILVLLVLILICCTVCGSSSKKKPQSILEKRGLALPPQRHQQHHHSTPHGGDNDGNTDDMGIHNHNHSSPGYMTPQKGTHSQYSSPYMNTHTPTITPTTTPVPSSRQSPLQSSPPLPSSSATSSPVQMLGSFDPTTGWD